MVFSSLQFVLVFVPMFFGAYYLVPDKFKNIVLFAGSMCFYLIGTVDTPIHFALFIASIALDYFLGLLISKSSKHKKLLLFSGVALHIVALAIFKYANFVFGEISFLFSQFAVDVEIALPIGISFYTFQGLSYIIDVYRGKIEPEKSLLGYAVYISMFEQLIAGPIVTYGEVQTDLYSRKIKPQAVLNGVGIFVFGLGLKVLLANPLGKLWNQTVAIGFESISTPLAWIAIIGYSFQIYFDFFGYLLMAIGLGKMLGFELPKNFDHPYLSKSMTEFWRRWHITLGSWFREYVYIPLGGNRERNVTTIRNLIVVWLLTGIWHGAGYNFILWGVLLAVVIISEKYVMGGFLKKHPIIAHTYMIILIPLMWSVFAIDDFNALCVFFSRLFPFFDQGVWSVFRYDYLKYLKMYFPFLSVGVLFSTKLPYKFLEKHRKSVIIIPFLIVVFAASVYCMYKGFDDPFLYFRF